MVSFLARARDRGFQRFSSGVGRCIRWLRLSDGITPSRRKTNSNNPCLKEHLQTELYRSRIQSRADHAEARHSQRCSRSAEIRMIESVEEFCAKLSGNPFGDAGDLRHREIEIDESRRPHIGQRARRISESERRRL